MQLNLVQAMIQLGQLLQILVPKIVVGPVMVQYIYKDSKLVFILGWFGSEIEMSVHVTLITLINVEVGINVEGLQKLPNH